MNCTWDNVTCQTASVTEIGARGYNLEVSNVPLTYEALVTVGFLATILIISYWALVKRTRIKQNERPNHIPVLKERTKE